MSDTKQEDQFTFDSPATGIFCKEKKVVPEQPTEIKLPEQHIEIKLKQGVLKFDMEDKTFLKGRWFYYDKKNTLISIPASEKDQVNKYNRERFDTKYAVYALGVKNLIQKRILHINFDIMDYRLKNLEVLSIFKYKKLYAELD